MALLRALPDVVEQPVERGAGARMVRVFGAMAACTASIVEVRQVELVDALMLGQRHQVGQLRRVGFGQRHAHAHAQAGRTRGAQARQRLRKGAVAAAEAVVRGGQAVQADADVVEARCR
ncbi:hypothetical protein D3C72_2000680 [compost metagenome]